jgi:hypothetical protein
MSEANESRHHAFAEASAERQRLLEQFAQAWERGQQPVLSEYLPLKAPDRWPVLIDLVRADLGYRLKGGEAVRIETYLSSYPELASDRDVLLELISTEYRLRRAREPQLTHEEYLRRFPQYQQELAAPDEAGDRPAQEAAADDPWATRLSAAGSGPEPAPMPPTDPAYPAVPGYEVLGILGRGGMGVVYKARQVRLKRLVALKMIRTGSHAGPEELARFQREAEAVARLQHPHIVQIYEIGEQDHLPYFSLELVEGGSLAARLAGKALPAEQAARLAETLARAVHAAHQRGIVHRDLKPGNVLMTADGLPKVADFGLAKLLDTDAGQTQSGAVLGTPSYMAPEQAAGKGQEMGPRVDVYALGAILYELLTGRPPFRAATPLETLEQVRNQEPVPPSRLQPRVPRDLETICLKALAKEPSRRYSSALLLAQDLERFLAGEAILARPDRLVPKLWRKARRRPLVPLSVLVVALAIPLLGYLAVTVRDARRIVNRTQDFDAHLTTDLTEDYLQHMESRLDELKGLDAEKAASARATLYERFAESFRGKLHVPRLEPDTRAQLECALNILVSRDPALADRLRREFTDRLTRPETVCKLAAPFSELGSVFAPTQVCLAQEKTLLARTPGTPALDPLVLTRVPAESNAGLEAVFDYPSWPSASQLGLVLNAAKGSGYTFLLRTPSSADTLGALKKRGGLVRLQICRKGKVLREQQVKASDLAEGPLQLEAWREGDRLTFQVKGLPPVDFQDAFPLSGSDLGVFGLHWPAGVRLQRLRAECQALPPAPSPLERGDELYARGAYPVALQEYQQQAIASGAKLVGQEASYKQALCLIQVKSYPEAAKILALLVAEKGSRWPLMARLQLFLVRLRQNQLEEADSLLKGLAFTPTDVMEGPPSRPRLEQLADLVPDEVFQEIWQASFPTYAGLNLVLLVVRFNPHYLDLLEQLDVLAGYLHFQPRQRTLLKFTLVWAYLLADRNSDATRTLKDLLERENDEVQQLGLQVDLIPLYCWLLCASGEATSALEVVGRYLEERPGVYREPYLFLLGERARIHAVLKQWDQAEKDLDEWFRVASEERMSYLGYGTAWLLRGFLEEQRGRPDRAVAAWRRGLFKAYAQRKGRPPARPDPFRLGGMQNVAIGLMLGSLADDLSDKDVTELLSQLAPYFSGLPVWWVRAHVLDVVPAAVLRRIFQRPQGHDYARKLAFHDLSAREALRGMVLALAAEILRYGAFSSNPTPEQEAILWKVAEDGYGIYWSGKLSLDQLQAQLRPLLAIWQGKLDKTAWERVLPEVEPSFRGGLAYVFGRRLIMANKLPDAEVLLRTALSYAPPGSTLHRLTQTELGRLKAYQLNNSSWAVVRQPGAAAAAYGQALREADEACRLAPDDGSIRNTLGAAQYRVGQYQAALQTLTQSDQLNSARFKDSIPADLALLAMARHHLGHKEQAQANLGRLRERMKKLPRDEDPDGQALFREAEELLTLPEK